MTELSVLMPVYNEARTLESIVERVLAIPIDLKNEIVSVDDGSSDRSAEVRHKLAAQDERIKVGRDDRATARSELHRRRPQACLTEALVPSRDLV